MKHIFGISEANLGTYASSWNHCNDHSANKSECLFHSVLGLLKSLIRNVQRCWNRKLFRKHCLVSLSEKLNNSFNESASYSSYQQVVSFIWAVTRRVVPRDLLGNTSMWRALRKNISKFVRLRRFEIFSLKQCIHGLKTSCYPFLSKIMLSDCHCYCRNKGMKDSGNGISPRKQSRSSDDVKPTLRDKFFQCWIYWYFSYIVVPMIGANFYATETESGRQDVFYCPKPVWKNLVRRTITRLGMQNYMLIDNACLRKILKHRIFGFSKVRFIPKEKNLRPITNLKAPSKLRLPCNESAARYCFAAIPKKAKIQGNLITTNRKRRTFHYKSVNSSLRELYAILRKVKTDYPQKLGSSVFDYNDIYKKLLQFLNKARNETERLPRVFIVVADVSKAFDSINQDKLIGIMKGVIEEDEYLLRKYAQIVCTKNSTKAIYDQVPYDQDHINNVIADVGTSTNLCSTSGILIDQGKNNKIKQEELHFLLREHLKRNVVKLGQKFYLQKVGISQGSLISSLLCSFYYADLENNLITPYLEKALEHPNADYKNNKDFANRCVCTSNNSGMEIVDSSCHEMEPLQNRACQDQSKTLCPCCHTSVVCTDEVKYPNSSLPNNLLMRLIDDFLFISTSRTQAANFLNRMQRGFIHYNCFMNNAKFGLNFDLERKHNLVNRMYTGSDGTSFLPWSGLLLNCKTLEVQADYTRYWGVHISSTITVHAHARPAYHLKAKICDYMRPKCHPIFYDSRINSPAVVSLNTYQAFLLCAMKFHCYTCSMPTITKQNPTYLLEIIERSFSYMYKLIKKRIYEAKQNLDVKKTFNLKKREMIWLGLSAYIRVLGKKQSCHKDLLSRLRCKFALQKRLCDASSHLSYAVDDSHSWMCWKIKF